ncbi:hypothetical protein [Citrobacter sedlakii]|uniref:hypothetical protein n=1 Tax=Citrobacter sedlakii TaxID=67826 RepID=UPI00388F30DB
MSIKDLVSNIKHNGLMTSMAQLEKLYRIAIENEEKLAESEARCAALAAENSALREFRPQPSGAAMMEALDAFYEYHEDVPEQGMMAAFEMLCCKRPKTPATDAFLAEVRAHGVEMFAGEIGDYAKGKSQATAEIIKATGRNALMFAAQLRKEAQ